MFIYHIGLKGQVITKVDLTDLPGDKHLKFYYHLIGCDLVEAVRLPDSSDVFYVDEEGMLGKQDRSIMTTIFRYPAPPVYIFGDLIYIGTDMETGESASPADGFRVFSQTGEIKWQVQNMPGNHGIVSRGPEGEINFDYNETHWKDYEDFNR